MKKRDGSPRVSAWRSTSLTPWKWLVLGIRVMEGWRWWEDPLDSLPRVDARLPCWRGQSKSIVLCVCVWGFSEVEHNFLKVVHISGLLFSWYFGSKNKLLLGYFAVCLWCFWLGGFNSKTVIHETTTTATTKKKPGNHFVIP